MFKTLIALVLFAQFSVAAEQPKVRTWVDGNGNTHYGDVEPIPKDYDEETKKAIIEGRESEISVITPEDLKSSNVAPSPQPLPAQPK